MTGDGAERLLSAQAPILASVSRAPPQLTHQELARAQAATLSTPRRHYCAPARALFFLLDLIYGRGRILEKFRVLELIARVPYQAWEHAAYVATTHVHEQGALARRIHDRVIEARAQQDNELWHLLVLDEVIAAQGKALGRVRSVWLPQVIAFAYYQLAWLLYVWNPAWSYRLNADFEDHAEHEYAKLTEEHPEWETIAFTSQFASEDRNFQSLADVFRQISHDERVHKLESEQKIAVARFQ